VTVKLNGPFYSGKNNSVDILFWTKYNETFWNLCSTPSMSKSGLQFSVSIIRSTRLLVWPPSVTVKL